MGTICAPAYTNISWLNSSKRQINTFLYIDDLFMVWTKSEKAAERFYE